MQIEALNGDSWKLSLKKMETWLSALFSPDKFSQSFFYNKFLKTFH